jgi:hypothetical protein
MTALVVTDLRIDIASVLASLRQGPLYRQDFSVALAGICLDFPQIFPETGDFPVWGWAAWMTGKG